MKESRSRELLLLIRHYVMFFLIVAFLITCCLMLFASTLADTMGIVFTDENIGKAAKLTFINVLGLSGIMTLLDILRRRFIANRPMTRIAEVTERMSRGDFSARIPEFKGVLGETQYNLIGACFNKMAEELSGMNVLRTDFIANVSHELKTPLTVIQNYCTLLQQPGLTDEKRMEYTDSMIDATRRLSVLITNILKLNKLENQQIMPIRAEYKLDEQLIECLLQYENVWEQKEIRIETDIAEGVTVCADAELLSLVWNNLFSNAFKFTETGGTVSLSLAATDEEAVVQVRDTGCGISEDVGRHIFEKFYQGDTSRATQGNGLGLALVKRVIDMLQGEISVQSEVDVGSTFTVKIRRN